MQTLFHVHELLALAFEHSADRYAGPGGNDIGNILLCDLLAEQAFAGGKFLQGFFGRSPFLLQFGDAPVLNLRGQVQITGALGLFQFDFRIFELAIHHADGVEGGLFVLPLGFELGGLFFEIGEVFLQLLQALAGGFVFFFFERALLDFQLHDLPLQLIDFGGHGVQLHAQARSGFIHQINGFIRQKAIADIAVRERGRRHQRGILNANAVVYFITLL